MSRRRGPRKHPASALTLPIAAALLVRWLSELNYRHVTEHRIFAKFEVVTLSEQHLEAGQLHHFRVFTPGANKTSDERSCHDREQS